MRKHHPKNERIKRKYLTHLEEAKRCTLKTTDQVAAAITLFERSTNWKDFAAFHIEQAKAFKRKQYNTINSRTGKPLAKSTVHSRLMHLKAFFLWLAGQPGYKSKISYSDSDYFNPTANDTRIATAKRERPAPTLEQIACVVENLPTDTVIQRRDRALIALTILTGARDDAIASLSLKHVDLTNRTLDQDSRDVRTKYRKSQLTKFFPVGGDHEAIVANWVTELREEKLFGPDDPVFPMNKIGHNADQQFATIGIDRKHWKNAAAIRRIFKDSFTLSDLPYFNPHSFRKTLGQLGERICSTPEQFKAWSQNLGHDNVLTTFTSYGEVSKRRQAEILENLAGVDLVSSENVGGSALEEMEALIQRMKANNAA